MTNQARILVDARLPWGSGIGRYVRNIVPAVAAQMPSARFTVLVSPDDADRAGETIGHGDTVDVRATAIRPFSLREQVELPALASGYDLTWFTNYWVPLRWRGRFVTTVHDLIHLDPRFPASSLKRFAAARTFAKIRREADHIIFVSRFSARLFEQRIGQPKSSSVVHHGIDHVGIASTASSRQRDCFALVVAASKRHKNLPLLLAAWRQAITEGWRLVAVTPGDELRSSIDLERHVGDATNITVQRGISDTALEDLYAIAGFALVPSRYEGFGLPLLEAMRAGTPVVSSTADALVEVATGARIPFVSPDDREGWIDAIHQMMAEHNSRSDTQRALSAHNKAVADRFTWTRAGAGTAEALARALD